MSSKESKNLILFII